jgi:DNA-binding GntR family transcriptional regulator
MDKESAYKELKRKIFSEDLIPGQWLVEIDISAAYKLRRTPVREILRLKNRLKS